MLIFRKRFFDMQNKKIHFLQNYFEIHFGLKKMYIFAKKKIIHFWRQDEINNKTFCFSFFFLRLEINFKFKKNVCFKKKNQGDRTQNVPRNVL